MEKKAYARWGPLDKPPVSSDGASKEFSFQVFHGEHNHGAGTQKLNSTCVHSFDSMTQRATKLTRW